MNFSLRALLLLVAYIAAGCATLRYPNELVAGAWLIATPLVLLLAILAAIIRRAERRAFWLGFAIFGWGHLLLSASPLGQETITVGLLRHCYLKIYENERSNHDDPFAVQGSNTSSTRNRNAMTVIRVPTVFVLAQWAPDNIVGPTPERWVPAMQTYIALGQAIITLLVAMLGGQLGKFMALNETSRQRPPAG